MLHFTNSGTEYLRILKSFDWYGFWSTLDLSPFPVIIFNSDGEFLNSWGEGEFLRPHGITHDKEDNVYLIDDQGHMVEKRDINGNLLFRLGNKGKGSPRQSGIFFNLPTMFSFVFTITEFENSSLPKYLFFSFVILFSNNTFTILF